MRITDRIPNSFKRVKPMWATRPRRPEQLAILAGSIAVNAIPAPLKGTVKEQDAQCGRAFKHGVNTYLARAAASRRKFLRFNTTPDWVGVRAAQQGAFEALK